VIEEPLSSGFSQVILKLGYERYKVVTGSIVAGTLAGVRCPTSDKSP